MSNENPRVIVALDVSNKAEALVLCNEFHPELCAVKIGKELFTAEGPELVSLIIERGYKVFLDLKYHDIPTTVYNAVKVAAELGVWMVNIHASGGSKMMKKARLAINESSNKPLLIAVTVLTSMEQEDLKEIGLGIDPMQQVRRLAILAKNSGVDGVVCSARELGVVREACGSDFLTVTPGIRPEGSDVGDQKRVMTPLDALNAGVDYMVIGRPITQSENPRRTLYDIVTSLQWGCNYKAGIAGFYFSKKSIQYISIKFNKQK